jgi:hypothetical protein
MGLRRKENLGTSGLSRDYVARLYFGTLAWRRRLYRERGATSQAPSAPVPPTARDGD